MEGEKAKDGHGWYRHRQESIGSTATVYNLGNIRAMRVIPSELIKQTLEIHPR